MWVLEVNDSPSLNINLCLEGDKGLIKHASEVDRLIKTTVVGDAIKLMRKYKKKVRSDVGEYKIWKQILPSDQTDQCDLIMRAKYIFEILASKGSAKLTS